MAQFDDGTFDGWRIEWEGHEGGLLGSPDPPPLTLIARKLDGTAMQKVVLVGLSPSQVEVKLYGILGAVAQKVIASYHLDDPLEYGGVPNY